MLTSVLLPTLTLSQFLGEFVGTFLFLFFAFTGTQVANNLVDTPDASTLLYISLAFGFSLSVNAWAFYKISGGLFNPAVTLGLFLSGCFTWLRSLVFFIAQLLGSIASAGVVSCLFPGVSQPQLRQYRNTNDDRGSMLLQN